MSYFAPRRDKLRKLLKKNDVDSLLVTNFTNVTYLTGFTGDDSYLLVRRDGETLISDMRYTTQLEEECPGLDLHIRPPGTKMHEVTGEVLEKAKAGRVGIEAESLTVGLLGKLEKAAPNTTFAPTSGLVESLRVVKDKQEVEAIRRAARQAERAFAAVMAGLTPEMTEKQVSADLEHTARRFGAKGLSFTPIVAVGPRAALPHAPPSDHRIGESDFTLVDWGANEHLYMSDLTRVVVTGKISGRLQKIHDIVRQAQEAAIEAIRPGKTCEEVDAVARKIIEKAGYGKQFGHGLGHGVGLNIHEAPRLAQNEKNELKAGMVVTVEPGIYLPGWGGVRIEDDVLVTRDGHEVLTNVPKDLGQLVIA
jgi:Xaa-Pro aminopeptidase